jgi:hypothetical protein
MTRTIKKFNTAFNKYNNTTCLLFITQINNNIDYFINIKKKYNITCFMAIIINSDNINSYHIYNEENKCLYILANEKNYEYNIMQKYFDFHLIERNKI